MKDRVIVQIPFSGLYNSLWSDELDQVETREAEYFAEERQEEEGIPHALRLEAAEVSELFFRAADYSKAHLGIAQAYTSAFADAFDNKVFPDLALEFESMTSPKYYNFETDRIFAWADAEAIRELAETIDKKAMTKVAKERHTSRSGFSSFYDPDWSTWGPVDTWDHNQLHTLLLAAIDATGEDVNDWAFQLYEEMYEDIGRAFSDCVDWDQFEALCAEAREEKEAELREEDPDYVPVPVRCKHTLEMFPRV
jgi:hypothetical protein